MPYVPPHKRLDASSTPEAMPGRGRGASSSGGRGVGRIKELFIRNAAHSSRKLVVLAPPGSALRLDRFSGESYPHLRDFALYTASMVNADDLSATIESKLALDDARSMSSSIVEKVLPDFLAALGEVRSLMDQSEPGAVRPKVLFKFGTLIFHCLNGKALTSDEEFHADSLEKSVQGELGLRLSKTFDTSISEEAFNELKELALAGAEQTVDKIRYTIQIRGEDHSKHVLKCSCIPAELGAGLQLTKIKYEPLRHMVTDVLCARKKLDVRLIMYTETHPQDLSDDQKEALHALVDAAVVDENVKGGLRWPLGKDSFGRFKVQGAFQVKKTILFESGRKWIFAAANRAHLENSTVRLSFEAQIGLKGWKSFVANGDENQDSAQQLLCKMVDAGVQGI